MKNVLDKIIILGVVVVIASLLFGGSTDKKFGGVVQGSEYLATTTRSTSAGTHWLAKSTTNARVCVLGSVVVASSSPDATLVLWNATSTTDSASSTIATLKASIGEGTYTYDITCSRGIVVETPSGFNGEYTITYR